MRVNLLLVTSLVIALTTSACSDIVSDGFEYATIEVDARVRSGEPVPGVILTLHAGSVPLEYGITDGRGQYVFKSVPMGGVGVFAGPPEQYIPLDRSAFQHVLFRIEEGETRAIEFLYLKSGDGQIVVTALTPSSQPVPGVQLVLYTPTEVVGEGITDESGTFVFDPVPMGDYGVRAFAPLGYVTEDGLTDTWVDGLLIDEGWVEDVAFTFAPCAGSLRVDAVDQSGEPVNGLGLILYTSGGILSSDEATNAEGSHVYSDLACGDYGVRISPLAGYTFEEGDGSSYIDGILIGHDQEEVVQFQLDRCEGEIQISVVDVAGAPIQGAQLALYNSTATLGGGTTDATGIHQFTGLPCGSGYAVSVTPPEGYSVESGPGSSYVDGIDLLSGSQVEFTFVLVGS